MRDCVLTVYGDDGVIAHEARVVVPALPERSVLEKLWRDGIDQRGARYAVAREDRVVRALYLAEDLLPAAATRLSGKKTRLGRWITTAATLGATVADRVFIGPDLFFRQVDVSGPETWLASMFCTLGSDLDVRQRKFADGSAYEWEFRSDLFYYRGGPGRWALYGAGNTSTDRIDRVIEVDKPATVADFLWTIGAQRLVGSRKRG